MTVSPITCPAAGTAKDYEEISNAMDRANKDKQSMNHDSRFSTFIGWVLVVLGSLITAAICWGSVSLVSMKTDIAVLLSRPIGIGRDDYARDMNRLDSEILRLQIDLNTEVERTRQMQRLQ